MMPPTRLSGPPSSSLSPGTEDMDEKLAKTLAAPDFFAWRNRIWKEISDEAIGKGWVPEAEITEMGVIDHCCERWSQLYARMVGSISCSLWECALGDMRADEMKG